jgi:hypothetical protein
MKGDNLALTVSATGTPILMHKVHTKNTLIYTIKIKKLNLTFSFFLLKSTRSDDEKYNPVQSFCDTLVQYHKYLHFIFNFIFNFVLPLLFFDTKMKSPQNLGN